MKHERSLHSPVFIHGEACAICDLESAHLNNWIQRGVIDIGTMMLGRRAYNIIDLIKLRVIGDLARTVTMRPAFAAAIAESVIPRAMEIAALDSNGRLKHRRYSGAEADPQYLVAWVEPEKDNFTVKRTTASLLHKAVAVPHPVIVVPLDEISLETTRRALRHLDQERAGT